MYSHVTMGDDECLDQMQAVLSEGPCSRLPTEPTQLLPHVFIGSQQNAENLRMLRRLRITHVLNCAGYKGPRPKPYASPYEGLEIEYYEFQAEDTDQYDIRQHFPEAFSFLNSCLRKGGVCLVHCALGINRSGAVCVAYVMMHKGISLLAAVRHIKNRRSLVLCNRSFQRQLVIYTRSHGMSRGGGVDSLVLNSSKPHKSAEKTDRGIGPHEALAEDFLERSRRLRKAVSQPNTTQGARPCVTYQSTYRSKNTYN